MTENGPDFQRLRCALYRGEPDRVPLAEITIDEGAKEAFLGKPVNDLKTDVEFYVRAGYDFMTLGRRIAGFPPIWDAARRDNYYSVQRQVGHGMSEGVIQDWADFRDYPWPGPSALDCRILDQAEGLLPPGMKVIRYMGPVFQMTWMLMGFNAFCYKLADDPALVKAVFERIFEVVYAEFEDALQREIVGAVWYGDDIAIKDRLMVSPDFLREVFFPKLRLLGEGCRRRGIPLLYHTDGNVSMVFDDIISAGVDALHPIDPLGMDIYEVRKQLAGKLAIIGNVDVDLLLHGTPEQVAEDTRRHLRELAPGGGYIMGSSNSIPRTVKPENYRAMLETTLQWGAYPISVP
ncbi:MAG: uroporphyrinogen decarboxylase family protein [Acidobacteriota bacterium]